MNKRGLEEKRQEQAVLATRSGCDTTHHVRTRRRSRRVDSITIYYRSVGRGLAAEVLIFNDRREVVKGIAQYGQPPE